MSKVILYIATSLDGYIATKDNNVSWLKGDDSDPENFGSYEMFYESIDTIILGYNTYHEIVNVLAKDKWPYVGKKTYVLTSKDLKDEEDIFFIKENLESLIEKLKKESEKDIWICGGARLFNELHNLDLVDEYCISMIPTILGDGIKLFNSNAKYQELKLLSTCNYNGIVDLYYCKK